LTEQVGDEEVYRLMHGCVPMMQAAVEKHEGTVTQFRGDGSWPSSGHRSRSSRPLGLGPLQPAPLVR
jgi:class 3 adenylate cyclase